VLPIERAPEHKPNQTDEIRIYLLIYEGIYRMLKARRWLGMFEKEAIWSRRMI